MGDCLPPTPITVLKQVWVLMMTTKKSSLRVKPGDPPSSHMEKFLRPLSAKSYAKSPLPLGGLLSHPAARFPYWVTLKFIIPALVNGCVQLFRANIIGNGQECNMLWGQRYFPIVKQFCSPTYLFISLRISYVRTVFTSLQPLLLPPNTFCLPPSFSQMCDFFSPFSVAHMYICLEMTT